MSQYRQAIRFAHIIAKAVNKDIIVKKVFLHRKYNEYCIELLDKKAMLSFGFSPFKHKSSSVLNYINIIEDEYNFNDAINKLPDYYKFLTAKLISMIQDKIRNNKMTILKEGKLPTKYYYGECPKCGTIFQATEEDAIHYHVWPTSSFYTADCPLCKERMIKVEPYEQAKQMLSDNGIAIGTGKINWRYSGGNALKNPTEVQEPYTTTEYLISSTPKSTITLHCSGTASPADIQKLIAKLKQLSI